MSHIVASFTVFEIVAGAIVLAIILEQRRRFEPQLKALARHFLENLVAEIELHAADVKPPLKMSASGRTLPSRLYDGSLEPSEESKFMSADIPANVASITGPLADFVVQEFEANEASLLPIVQAKESEAEGILVNIITAMPSPGGFLGLFPELVKSAAQKYASAIVAKYGAPVLLKFVDAEAQQLAKALGG